MSDLVPAYKLEPPGIIAEPANGLTFITAGEVWIDPVNGDEYAANGYGLFEARFNGQVVRERPGHPLVLRDELQKNWDGLTELFRAKGLDQEQLIKIMRYHGVKLEFVPPIYSQSVDLAVQADLGTAFGVKQLYELLEDARKMWAQFSSDWCIDLLEGRGVKFTVDFIPDCEKPPYSKGLYTAVTNFTRAHDLSVRLDVDRMASATGMQTRCTPATVSEYSNRAPIKPFLVKDLKAAKDRWLTMKEEALAEGITISHCQSLLEQIARDPLTGPPEPLITPKRIKLLEKQLVEYEIPRAREDRIRRERKEERLAGIPKQSAEVPTDHTVLGEVTEEEVQLAYARLFGSPEPEPEPAPEPERGALIQFDYEKPNMEEAPPVEEKQEVVNHDSALGQSESKQPETGAGVLLILPEPPPAVSDDEASEILRKPVFAIKEDAHLDWLVDRINTLQREVKALQEEKKDRAGHLDVMINELERNIKKLHWRFTQDVIDYVVPLLPRHLEGDEEGVLKERNYKVTTGKVTIGPTGGATCVDEKAWKSWIKHLPEEECALYGVDVEKVNKQSKDTASSLVEAGLQIPGWRLFPYNECGEFSVSVSKPRKKAADSAEGEDAA